MAVSLLDAVADLYRIAVTERAATSTQRLKVLAQYCADQLDRLGLAGAEIEREVPGIGREKQWDVAWYHEGKCRLAISLKSILRNVSGTVPNRIDDLIGEVANAQLASSTTNVAAARWGRNSVGVEVDTSYFRGAVTRLQAEGGLLASVTVRESPPQLPERHAAGG
ncbi:hypothetical protein [Caldinitratiruptor microaerophilus]|uniref:Uncharacterized protein n=1 Tax=Caldinitratiruptor microaerophilus TaxID=671077 RepID=A0AA35CM56_9FIRM|nr:hypothetical protein [Caldinitratiruptor microaerophilus]BDG60102.1 hypothetical protein caldi_11920 [Caldinitratiruptor microaerophilus]